jgi:flagellar biosynthesis GTPase FlhF
MSDVTTNAGVVNAQEQAEQAAQLSAEQQAEVMEQAKKELGLVVKALRSGNRENAVSQYLAGLHGLRFINLCRRGGKARSFATGELERDLSWWLGKTVDANLILRTYAAINLLHGDIMPPPSSAKAKERNEWAELVDRLPPVGHFHKAWSQLVERVDDGTEERWVLLPGFEEKCKTLYQDVQSKGVKLEDNTDGGRVVEKGILTLTREFMVEFMRYKADKKAAEAAAKSEAKEALEEEAKDFEDKAQEQQKVVKSLLEQSAQAAPQDKAKLEQEAKEAAKVLEEYRKNMRQLVDQAAAAAKEAREAEQEALDSEKKAEKGTAKLERRRGETDNGRELPWQALGENAAAQSTAKDLAEALYGIVSKHAEPEDVLYAMLTLHRKDASNAFKAALQAFGVTWERKTKAPEKVPA